MKSFMFSSVIYTALTDVSCADGDPTVERAVVDPIGRLGRVALPPVCAVGDGLDATPSSVFSSSITVEALFGCSGASEGCQ